MIKVTKCNSGQLMHCMLGTVHKWSRVQGIKKHMKQLNNTNSTATLAPHNAPCTFDIQNKRFKRYKNMKICYLFVTALDRLTKGLL